MKKYFLFRILRSIISIILVTTITYSIIYSMVPRKAIFENDIFYNKLKAKPDELLDYENTAFSKMGYIDYYNPKRLVDEVKKVDASYSAEHNAKNQQILTAWAKENGWELNTLPLSKNFYATKEIPLIKRVFNFYTNLIEIDHPWKIQDPENPNLPRYLTFEQDPQVGYALVGSGTKYKYQIYFTDDFPYIHQNIVSFNLGTSYPTFAGENITQVIAGGQGKTQRGQITTKEGKKRFSSADIYSRSYKPTSQISPQEALLFDDNYVKTTNNFQDPSMIGISFRIGIVALLISYLIAIPLAVAMAHYRGQWIDKLGITLVTILISVPSVAFVYFFRHLGSAFFGLPDLFPLFGAGDIRSYLMPMVILGLLGISGLIIWIRRYMIDQKSADYVKFAKAKGLNAREVSAKHIFKNAVIPIVNGIPGSIIGVIGGATITETVFAAPGMGKMLPEAIITHNNPLVIGLVFIFTTISVFSLLLGDVMMTLVDPRINLAVHKDK